jgi:hypothetical protein
MKYVLIIYGNQELWQSIAGQTWTETVAQFDAFNDRYFRTGELIAGYGLADAEEAKVLRVRDGRPAVTDGPYLESKEHLATFYLLEVSSEERAYAIAADCPAARLAQVEVWPITHEGKRHPA